MKKKNFFVIILSLIPIITTICVSNIVKISKSTFENKIYSDVTIEDDFDDKSLIVVLDKKTSKLNRKHYKSLLKKINYDNIFDLTKYDNECIIENNDFEQILQLNFKIASKSNIISAIKKIEKISGIKYVGPNRHFDVDETPNDQYYSYSTTQVNNQWAHSNICSENAWNFTTGLQEVRVGVIDTGISPHPDLNANLVSGLDFTYMNDTNNPGIARNDPTGHGTKVAGVIGAVGNNNIGVCGANWNITLVPMQVSNTNGTINSNACVNAVKYAIDTWNTENKISILSMSIGSSTIWPEMECMIRNYTNLGGLFICSTGNTSQNNDITYHYPSYYGSSLYSNQISNMITVGRCDINNQLPDGANWGSQTISLYAPGQNILTTYPIEKCSQTASLCQQSNTHIAYGYHVSNGSSLSTPYVTGVAALLLSLKSTLTATQIKNAILNGYDAITITLPDDSTQNVKKLNAFKALKYVFNNYSTSKTLSNHTTSSSQYVNSANNYFYTKNQFTKLNITSSKNYNFTISASSAINVKLYNTSLTNLSLSITSTNSNKTKKFTKSLSSGTYYLQTCFAGNDVVGNINVEILNHAYTDSYSWLNLTQHTSYCNCGNSKIEYHVVSSGGTILNSTNALKYQTCLLCGGNVERGFIQMGINSSSVNKVTRNGSYILPSGIIVLFEDDYEAFFNGTIEFYNKGEIEI